MSAPVPQSDLAALMDSFAAALSQGPVQHVNASDEPRGSTGLHGSGVMETWMAEQHQRALGLLANAMGRPVTLAQALLDCCTAWPDQAEADKWRRVIAVGDYMSARDQIAQAAKALA